MKNFKQLIETGDVVSKISIEVKVALRSYENNKESSQWKQHIRIAHLLLRSLLIVAVKSNADFCHAYDELVEITGFIEIFKYKEITIYVNAQLNNS